MIARVISHINESDPSEHGVKNECELPGSLRIRIPSGAVNLKDN